MSNTSLKTIITQVQSGNEQLESNANNTNKELNHLIIKT